MQKVIILAVLVSLIGFSQVNALLCYSCLTCTFPLASTSAVNCTGSCYSTTATVSALITSITTITKGCQASCSASSASVLGTGATTSCCTTDLCNQSSKTITMKLIPTLIFSFFIYKFF